MQEITKLFTVGKAEYSEHEDNFSSNNYSTISNESEQNDKKLLKE